MKYRVVVEFTGDFGVVDEPMATDFVRLVILHCQSPSLDVNLLRQIGIRTEVTARLHSVQKIEE